MRWVPEYGKDGPFVVQENEKVLTVFPFKTFESVHLLLFKRHVGERILLVLETLTRQRDLKREIDNQVFHLIEELLSLIASELFSKNVIRREECTLVEAS